ncbi:MAG TPA: flagellar basal-body MS-ring/collar protein FliF [Paenalcaligenes sp.]|nr:flagellar basal-body MS-ring/collar protein FliF [Paenalcaligenes sp.]
MSQIAHTLQRMPGLGFLRALPRWAQIGIAAALVAILVVILLWSRTPAYGILFSQIEDRDGGAIIAALEQMNVPYKLKDQGSAIYVPKGDVYKTRMNLAAQGLPRGGSVGYEIMDELRFGASQFTEQVNYQRAIEGELAQTIESLFSVEKARVHLALPRDTLFTRQRQPASASVMLTLYPGRHLAAEQVSAITWLVASSVPNLQAEHVSIVNQNGRLLSGSSEESKQLNQQRQITHEFEQLAIERILNILEPIVGEDNVRAQVNAEIDFAQREETSETYSPNQIPDTAAVRSEQQLTSIDNQPGLAQGVPGALSNQPPTPATAPIVTTEEDGTTDDNVSETNQNNSSTGQLLSALQESQQQASQANARTEIIRNYEVDRLIRHVKGAQNQLKRLSIAVVVNERPIDDDWQPLSTKELANLQDLVKQAVGYQIERGDTISIVNARFSDSQKKQSTHFLEKYDLVEMTFTLIKYLLLTLLFFAVWRIVLQPLIQNGLHTWAQAQAIREEQDKHLKREQSVQERAAEINRYEQNLNTARSMAEKDPRAVAMVLRAWMNKDQSNDSSRR